MPTPDIQLARPRREGLSGASDPSLSSPVAGEGTDEARQFRSVAAPPQRKLAGGPPEDPQRPINFHSILYAAPAAPPPDQAPDYFGDLNLDQVVNAMTAGRDEYELKPFYYAPLTKPSDIAYRQDVMRDVENPATLQALKAFALAMASMRRLLAQRDKMYYRLQKESLFLDAVDIYRLALAGLLDELRALGLRSPGFLSFRTFLSDYLGSSSYRALVAETEALKRDLGSIRYTMLIKTGMLTVMKYDGEADYGQDIQAVFAKFRQGAAAQHKFAFGDFPQINHIEAGVLDRVALLYPDIFARLDDYVRRHAAYLNDRLRAFDREIQFYVAYADYMSAFREAGLPICYPEMTRGQKMIEAKECFDLALAPRLIGEKKPIVLNDFYLRGVERLFIVSGPNQGGKTTFARTLGQLHHLAALGLPIPARKAKLYLFDKILTHFEREENIHNLRGKLQDDLVRIHDVLERATENSIVILNEIFNSTTLSDALFLSTKVLERLIGLDTIGVCVTFIDELATLSESTVSMVSTVRPNNPAERTFKIERRPADGLAYALSVAEKHRLTHTLLRERLTP